MCVHMFNIPSQDNLTASIHHSMDVLFHTTNLPALIYDFYLNLAKHLQKHLHHQTSMLVPPCFLLINEKKTNVNKNLNKINVQYLLPLSQSHSIYPFHCVEIFSFDQLFQ